MTRNATLQKEKQRVDRATLRELAGERFFERGREYFVRGQVLHCTDQGDSAEGLVLGTRAYCVGLRREEAGVSFHCDCPIGQMERFCKHAVALGLHWREGKVEEKKIETCDRLFELAINSQKLGGALFVDGKCYELTKQMLEDLLRSEPVREALGMIESVMSKIAEARELQIAEEEGDGEWEKMEELLCECHVEATRCAVKDARFAARRLLNWELSQAGAGFNPESIGGKLLRKYEESFGDDWRAAYRILVDEHRRKLQQLNDERPTLLNLDRRRRLIRLGRMVGEKVEKIEGRGPRCQSNGAVEQLWREFTASPSLRSFEQLKESALSLGQWPEWRERAFEYLRLRAAKTVERPAAKRRSFMLAGNDTDNSDLVSIWLAEGEVEEAYRVACAGDCADDIWLKLAALRIRTDPADALAIYKRTIRKLLARKDRYSAQQAGKLLRKTRRLMNRLNRQEEYKRFVDGLFRDFGSQRNFTRIIGQVSSLR
jgi:hypothetical protein